MKRDLTTSAPPALTARKAALRCRGFSLMEVLVLVVVLGIVAAAAGRALQAVARTPVTTDQTFQLETMLVSKMEELRATPFASLPLGPTQTMVTVGDPINPSMMKTYTMTIEITAADADGNNVPDANFRQIKVSVAGQQITTLVTR